MTDESARTDTDLDERSPADDGPDEGEEGAEATAERSPEVEEEEAAEAELEAELDHLQEEFDNLKDRHLRLAADFENYRRRAENEMNESWVRAQADLVRRLLDALDDLQRVTELEPEESSVESVLEGVRLVERKLFQAMEEAGVEVVQPEGERFDPEVMEALMRVPAESEDDDETVAQVIQKGYTFKGHLVRPARVSVRKYEDQ